MPLATCPHCGAKFWRDGSQATCGASSCTRAEREKRGTAATNTYSDWRRGWKRKKSNDDETGK